MALKASFLRSYVTTNKHGQKTDMFVYAVTGTTEELESFETTQGEYYRTEPDGTPVWITPKGYGSTCNLVIRAATEDRPAAVFADTSDIAMTMSLIERYKGTAFGDALAKELAAQMLAKPVAPATPAVG